MRLHFTMHKAGRRLMPQKSVGRLHEELGRRGVPWRPIAPLPTALIVFSNLLGA